MAALDIYRQNGSYMRPETVQIVMSMARLVKKQQGTAKTIYNDAYPDGDAFQLLTESIDMLEFCLGLDHPETGEAYSRMGLACQEAGNYRGASLWLRRAFCVFFKAFGPEDEVTLAAFRQVQQVDVNLQDTDL